MKINTPTKKIRTHEGAVAKHINPEMQLRRSVMACMLWEDEFYESGESIAKRIGELVAQVKPEVAASIAIEARNAMKLRHVPLLIARHMARLPEHRKLVASVLLEVIQRADELTEFVAIYWKNGKETLSAQVKKGLSMAFGKFSAYDLAKYNRDGAVKLRDVLFLCHAKPANAEQDAIWKKLIDGTLPPPDTWEVALSVGGPEADKKAIWERLLSEGKLGALALLRNLRNMQQAGVDVGSIRNALAAVKVERVLPYRFIAAARYAPNLEPELEQAMFKCLKDQTPLPGRTTLLVDVSGSMDAAISLMSELRRIDAACGLAMLLRELSTDIRIFTFSNNGVFIPPRRGFALRDAIASSQPHESTQLGMAVSAVEKGSYDRLIVITDEQAAGSVPDPDGRAYMINVASARNGVGYGKWLHIDGWSEAVVTYIRAFEADFAQE